MKVLAALLLVASTLVLSDNPRSGSLLTRDDFCGTDQFGANWYCTDSNTECCIGSIQGNCMPAGYNCCDTGFFCGPNKQCVLRDGVQYCVGSGSDDEDEEAQASGDRGEGEEAEQLGGSDDDDDDNDDEDDDSAAMTLAGMKTLALLPLVGAMMAWL